jgi:hypothetical protein
MSNAEDELQALRRLTQDYRSVVDELKARGWIEERQEPKQGPITSTELAPPKSKSGYIAIYFYIHDVTDGDENNTVIVQLVTKSPDDNRIKIFKAADFAQLGRQQALETFSATVMDYAKELER